MFIACSFSFDESATISSILFTLKVRFSLACQAMGFHVQGGMTVVDRLAIFISILSTMLKQPVNSLCRIDQRIEIHSPRCQLNRLLFFAIHGLCRSVPVDQRMASLLPSVENFSQNWKEEFPSGEKNNHQNRDVERHAD